MELNLSPPILHQHGKTRKGVPPQSFKPQPHESPSAENSQQLLCEEGDVLLLKPVFKPNVFLKTLKFLQNNGAARSGCMIKFEDLKASAHRVLKQPVLICTMR